MKCLSLVIIFEWCFPAKKTSNCLHIPSPALHVLVLVQSLTQAQNRRGNKKSCAYIFLQMYRIQKVHLTERSKSTSWGLGLTFHYPLCTPLLPGADWGKLCPTQFKFRNNQKISTFPCSFCCIFQCNYDLYHILENSSTKLRKPSFNFLSGLAALCCEAHGQWNLLAIAWEVCYNHKKKYPRATIFIFHTPLVAQKQFKHVTRNRTQLIKNNVPKLHWCVLHLELASANKHTQNQGQITINLSRQVQANCSVEVTCLSA